MPDGLMIKDLESSNGTFVNGKRVTEAKVGAGDELKLDTVRFLVQTPGMDAPENNETKTAQSRAVPEEPEEAPTSSPAVKWAVIITLLLAGTVAGLKFGGII